MIELTKRVALKATPLSITFLVMLFAPLSMVQATVMADLRLGKNPGFVRLVMEFNRPPAPSPSISVEGNRLQIDLKNIANAPAAPEIIDGIARLDVSRKADEARVEVVFAFTPTDVKTFALTGPHRFIVDTYRPLPVSAALPPAKENETVPAGQNADAIAEPSSVPESLASTSAPIPSEASRDAKAVADPGMGNTYPKRFQQRLVAALIAVTSIIVVLLFFLIRAGGGGLSARQQPWTHRLPETPDPTIEAIDLKIRKLLKTYDRM